jgi:hypothetical protein
MLRKTVYFGLALGMAISAAHVAGCGSSDSGGSTGDTGGTNDKCSDPGPTCGHPPAQPSGAPAGDGTDKTVLAMSKLFLGDTDRQGNTNANAWKSIGFNLDDLKSDAKSTDVCKPVSGANPTLVKTDGDNGIDNSFGENIMPIIVGLASDASQRINDSINQGQFTIMLAIDKLGTGPNYSGLSAALYGGGDLSKVAGHENGPTWDGTDPWPVLCELLQGCAQPSTKGDVNKPLVTFPTSYVANRTWVSGSAGDVSLSLSISGYALSLTIHHATITMDLGADNKSATNGTIGGVLSTDELNNGLKQVAGKISSSLCQGSTLDSILQQISQASDIMSDATQDPSKTCDGISVGLGFESKAVMLGDVTDPAQPGADPCASSGADGG